MCQVVEKYDAQLVAKAKDLDEQEGSKASTANDEGKGEEEEGPMVAAYRCFRAFITTPDSDSPYHDLMAQALALGAPAISQGVDGASGAVKADSMNEELFGRFTSWLRTNRPGITDKCVDQYSQLIDR